MTLKTSGGMSFMEEDMMDVDNALFLLRLYPFEKFSWRLCHTYAKT